jgi:hypothetical protein
VVRWYGVVLSLGTGHVLDEPVEVNSCLRVSEGGWDVVEVCFAAGSGVRLMVVVVYIVGVHVDMDVDCDVAAGVVAGSMFVGMMWCVSGVVVYMVVVWGGGFEVWVMGVVVVMSSFHLLSRFLA